MKLNEDSAKALLKGKSTLDAKAQKITKVESLGNYSKKITRANLSHNIIRTSDSLQGLCSLVNLTWLDLSHNGLSSFCLPGNYLGKLQVLNISHNAFSELPDFSSFTGMKALIANNNAIATIQGKHLPLSLNTLVLSHNNLEQISADLRAFPKLVKLSVSHNKIKEFPRKLPECLAELRLNGNQLCQIGPLPVKVNLLDLGSNKLTSLEEIKALLAPSGSPMKCLKNLSIKGIPLKEGAGMVLHEMFPRLAMLNNRPFDKSKI